MKRRAPMTKWQLRRNRRNSRKFVATGTYIPGTMIGRSRGCWWTYGGVKGHPASGRMGTP